MSKYIVHILLCLFFIYVCCIFYMKDTKVLKTEQQLKNIQNQKIELETKNVELNEQVVELQTEVQNKVQEIEKAQEEIQSLNKNIEKIKSSKAKVQTRSQTVAYNNISRGGYVRGSRDLSQDEINLLAKVVYLEAGNQSDEGQRAVVEVILNRVDSSHHSFPNSVSEVIYRKGQFSTVPMISRTAVREKELNNIRTVLNGGARVLPSSDYVYFATSRINGRNHIKIGDHWFSSL